MILKKCTELYSFLSNGVSVSIYRCHRLRNVFLSDSFFLNETTVHAVLYLIWLVYSTDIYQWKVLCNKRSLLAYIHGGYGSISTEFRKNGFLRKRIPLKSCEAPLWRCLRLLYQLLHAVSERLWFLWTQLPTWKCSWISHISLWLGFDQRE